ncbi:phosphate ABC transporter substrate-binding protein, partial [Klebsiella pneumoniae]
MASRREENMAERMTFPMYAIHRQQTQALWQAV